MDVFDRLEKESFVKKVRFNPERFPGMFVTFESNTILLFSSGKMVVIGANSEDSILLSLEKIVSYFTQYKPPHVKSESLFQSDSERVNIPDHDKEDIY